MRKTHTEFLRLFGIHDKMVVCMHSGEDCLTMIKIVAAFPEVKIQDVYGIDLLHIVVHLPDFYMLRYSL